MKKLIGILLLLVFSSFPSLSSAATTVGPDNSLCWDVPNTKTDGSPLDDLAGYKVYFGAVSNTYTGSIDVNLRPITTVPPQVCIQIKSFKDIGSLPNGPLFVSVIAYNTTKKESAFSNEITFVFSSTFTAFSPSSPKNFLQK